MRALLSSRILRTTSITALLAALLAAGPRTASAAPSPGGTVRGRGGNFGLGLSLGDPMGATMKLFLHPNHALQWDIGWMPLHHGAGGVTFSYLWAPANFVSNSVMDFFGYLGIGVGLALWVRGHAYGHAHNHDYHDHNTWGGLIWRIPVLGLAFHWKKAPFDTVIEGAWSPMMPEFTSGYARVGLAHGDISVKGRYYF